ncbi:amidohydrolase [Rhodospirillales bacterium]|nr:amidohydrolase [Rhodospirillales bacterium]
MSVIDIHTHMFGYAWLDMLNKHGAPNYASASMEDGRDYLMEMGSPACAFEDEAFDYDKRIKMMDNSGIDLAIVSLTSPNVQWGGEKISCETAKLANNEMAAGQTAYPDRIRWFASLPWEYPDAAVLELERALSIGAVGVFATAHINERDLIDPLFLPVWRAIDEKKLPVLLHPTAPYGSKQINFSKERILMPVAGFMFDTTLALSRMLLNGFFERFTSLKIIASHGGGFLPFIHGRIDVFFNEETLVKMPVTMKPSEYLEERIFYDAIVYDKGALDLLIQVAGPEKVMFGTDQPMPNDVPKLKDIIESRPANEHEPILSSNAQRMFNL